MQRSHGREDETTTSFALNFARADQPRHAAAPAELPPKIPSSRVMRRVMIAASLSVTFEIVNHEVDVLGRKSSPIPR